MTRTVQVGEDAAAELAEAVAWYEERRFGLGNALFEAVAAALDTIASHPEVGAGYGRDTRVRRLPVKRFPYQVIYLLSDDTIVVVAVAHTRRRPGYWRDRV